MTTENCPFCDVIQETEKENEHAIVLLSDPRKVPGHFLVIPKRHVEKPWELNEEELSSIFELVFFLQQKITETFAEGCDVRQHYRPFLEQSKFKVNHVHYHVIPRVFGDDIYTKAEQFEVELFEDLTEQEAQEIRKILK